MWDPSGLFQDILCLIGGVLCVALARKELTFLHEYTYVTSEKAGVHGVAGITLSGGLFLFSRFMAILEPLSILFFGLGCLFCSAGAIWLSLSEDKWKRDKKRVTSSKKRIYVVLGVLTGSYGFGRLMTL
jgi:hypothetical protein